MTRVLILITGFILYGSLYPWRYRPGAPGVHPLEVLLHSWPVRIGAADLGDIAVNLVLYIPIGIFAFLALDRFGHRWLRWLAPTLIALVLSASIETAQIYDQTRVCSLLDVLDNTVGSAFGTVLGYVFRESLSESLFLVFHWLGAQLFLLVALVAGRRSALHWFASPLETVTLSMAWLLVLYLLAAPDRPEYKGRLAAVLAAGVMSLLIVRGLSPFHFQSIPAHFNWVPFIGVLNAEWIVGLPVFLEKAFYYGTAIWLMRRAGMPLVYSTAIAGSILAGIEAAQRYLPNHTPEITDPLLACAMGLILWLLEQDYRFRNEHYHSFAMQPLR